MASSNKPRHEPQVTEHEYDGIQEYDNPMPRWWLLTFAATIIYSVIYLFNVGPVGNGKGRIADYEADMAAFAAAHPAPTGGPSSDRLLALVKDPKAVAVGKELFTKNCVSCHRADGGGLIGPNLADNYWIHGAILDSVYSVVSNGVLANPHLAVRGRRNVDVFIGQNFRPPDLVNARAPSFALRGAERSAPLAHLFLMCS